MRKISRFLFSRIFIVAVLIIIQLLLIINIFYSLSIYSDIISLCFSLLSLIMVIYIINRDDNPSFKLAWCITILIFPVIGGIFYLLFGGKKVPKGLQQGVLATVSESLAYFTDHHNVIDELSEIDQKISNQFNYVYKNGYFPVYKNTECTYFPSGEEMFEEYLVQLRKAEHFIYLEYFILAEGEMLSKVIDILKEKVDSGVIVRLIYDDFGSITTVPDNFVAKMSALGIQCVVFNRMRAQLMITMNNRDHRKITVVDNKVAFMGGINIADEYINKKERFGYWKDTAIMLEGEAVWSCTIMFAQFWNYCSKDHIDFNTFAYSSVKQSDGYIQPFSDSPTDNEEIGLNVHLNMINSAKNYVYIQTPYLIIGYELQKALCNAAKSGVDVRITVPFIPDKWYVHTMTKHNYPVLIDAGVKIYEYTPGFMHSKIIVCDDEIGICGTINMDYRSYYLHYECATMIYKSKALITMKKDYLETIEVSKEITKQDCENVSVVVQIWRSILHLFSPML